MVKADHCLSSYRCKINTTQGIRIWKGLMLERDRRSPATHRSVIRPCAISHMARRNIANAMVLGVDSSTTAGLDTGAKLRVFMAIIFTRGSAACLRSSTADSRYGMRIYLIATRIFHRLSRTTELNGLMRRSQP